MNMLQVTYTYVEVSISGKEGQYAQCIHLLLVNYAILLLSTTYLLHRYIRIYNNLNCQHFLIPKELMCYQD